MTIPFLTPTIFFILVTIFIMYKNGKYFFYKFLFLFVYLFLTSFFLKREPDHYTYLNFMTNTYTSISTALKANSGVYTFAASLVYIINQFVRSIDLSILINNSFTITCIICIPNIFSNNNSIIPLKKHIFQLALIILSPMIVTSGKNMNKDLAVSFYLCLSFYTFYYMIEKMREIIHLKIKDITNIIFMILLFIISTTYLNFVRSSLCSIFIVSIIIFIISKILYFIFNKKVHINFISIILIFISISYIQLFKWDSLIFSQSENLGNATIKELQGLSQPYIFDTLFYSLQGYFYSFFGIYISQLSTNTLSLINFIPSVIINITYLILIIKLIKSDKNNLTLQNLCFCFIFFHIGIQIWGTPNYSNLFRQQIPDVFLIAIFLLIHKMKLKDNKVEPPNYSNIQISVIKNSN
ncbi:hypothetical protein QEJ31_04335 [Pigmentibacter sp. JX0631]|uniref:hypothetical protein n=1 Tax=Pigmentibacter sp. JX0631 TaxID=2976982 RepID=UPI002468A1E7|nr:hypothetical protein [Pigmentibacter sp. JX0631]WGL60824.1 hypothetical protein QEJ31_04335 [Pigmentibacter sp. JX0631]